MSKALQTVIMRKLNDYRRIGKLKFNMANIWENA